jgi:hypothetical protein
MIPAYDIYKDIYESSYMIPAYEINDVYERR